MFARIILAAAAMAAFAAVPAFGQGNPLPGDPGRNVNLIGPTPDPGDIRDTGLKQQNEPACAVRPGNPACVICAYNDYRTVEKPVDVFGNPVIGDAWQGVSTSCDVGTGDVWRSRVAPGHAADDPAYRVLGQFAADPRLIALPGMALFNFITGYRDDNRGTLAVQHWLEVNREDSDPYEPAAATSIVDLGTDGRFIDKPDMLALLDPVGSQSTVSMSFVMENESLGTITRNFPTGDLLFAYAVFTGSNSVKVLVKSCTEWGRNCPNQATKLSEDQNLVSGISLSAIGDTVMAVWRRRSDNNEPDAIMWAVSNNRGKKWTKASSLPLCRFDMSSFTSGEFVTFRTNDFPWIANDGERFYLFYSDRSFDGSCTTGRPRIVMRYAQPGGNVSWSSAQALDNGPEASQGLQFMPTAFGARGKVQVAWYDTRREILPPLATPDSPKAVYRDQFVADYPEFISGRAVVNRKLDIYTARVEWDAVAGAPAVSEAVRVSQYRLAAESETGEISVPAIEGEASFGNVKAYDSGSKSFVGDYIAMAAPEFRKVFAADGTWTGKWEDNASALEDEPNDVDFFVAWTDQRDMRGEILPEILDQNTPFESSATGGSALRNDTENETDPEADARSLVAFGSPVDPPRDTNKTAEGVAGTEEFAGICAPGQLNPAQDRTRDANIYGSLIRDRLRLYAPTPSKPLLGLQRTFPVGLTNRNPTERRYRLIIANQPCNDETICRASWRQKPNGPLFVPREDPGFVAPTVIEDLTVPANSTLARTLFMVGASDDDQVRVDVYDADACDTGSPTCSVLSSITLGGTNSAAAGQLQQPDYDDSPICADITDPAARTACFNNLESELHNPELLNPELANPELLNPELANPELANPELLNPELLNPELLNPELLNPELANLGFENPELANPELANPELLNPELANPELANPELLNPELANPELANPELANSSLDDGITWTDYTYAIKNTGNVTTAFNADVALSGPDAENVDSQLIAHTLHIVPTSRDCSYRPQYESQVLATVNGPDDALDIADIDNPFNGGISALAAPGQTIFFTRRIFGTPAELANVIVSGFTASAQSANCREQVLDGQQSSDYICQENLLNAQELILLDTAPPTFDNVPTGTFEIAAEDADGVCTDLTAALGITATDNGEPVAVSCQVSDPPNLCAVPAPDEQIPLGPSTVTCTAVDFADPPNEATITIPVAVTDQTAPTITSLSASLNIDLGPNQGSASVDFESNVVASDNVSAPLEIAVACEISGNPPLTSNDSLPPGTYSVGCTATDPAGNSRIVDDLFSVAINDITAPQITTPGDLTRPAVDSTGAAVTFSVSATDAADPTPALSCSPASGGLFPLGPTTVSCSATDASGNQSEATFIVTVADQHAPVFNVAPAAPVRLPADASGVATLVFEDLVDATDNVDGAALISCRTDTGFVSGNLLPLGTHIVTCSATDSAGNSTSDTTPASDAVYTVIVEDVSAPVIFAPNDFTAAAADASGATVDYAVTVTDNADPAPSVSCQPPSGALFPLGATLVSCTATDAAGNGSATSFTITVADQTAPVFTTVPTSAVTVEAGPDGTATVDFESRVVATDNVDSDPVVSCRTNTGLSSGAPLSVGSYVVTCSATDSAGNSTSGSVPPGDASYTLIIADVTAPEISVPGDLTVPADNASGAAVTYSVTVTDNADSSPILSCSPASGALFVFGATTVSCDAQDASGNTATASFVVTVQFGAAFGIEFSKGRINSGSTVPLEFGWRNAAGELMDSSAADPVVTAMDESGRIVLNPGEFPGNSDLRWDPSSNTWRFNWQTVCSDTVGSDCPAGTPLPAATYLLQVISRATGQTIPDEGRTRIVIRD